MKPYKWDKIKCDGEEYQEMKVNIGDMNVWITAKSDEYFVESHDGNIISKGKTNSMAESKSSSVLALITIIDKTLYNLKSI